MAYENTGQVIDSMDDMGAKFNKPTENDKELTSFIVDHTDRWRDYRNQNFSDEWEKYERVFRGKWSANDKHRESERSRIISPATQQAVETRHAEMMEAIFGQGEFFDIDDDIKDANGTKIDVENLKNQLNEDFAQDKIRKAFDQIELMAELYGTGIGEITVSKEKFYYPEEKQIGQDQVAYGVNEKDRVCVKLNPVNPKNFLFDPNGSSVDDCMGVAIERYVSIHKIMQGISSGKYRKVDIGTLYKSNELEPTQEARNYQDEKVLLLTYYGLVPREYLTDTNETAAEERGDFSSEVEDYADMVEAIIVIANGDLLLKAEESPYMMKDRPVLTYQDDTVPNRLLGRGTVEKAFNMQSAVDSSMRLHFDAMALTASPMIAVDATRLPRGAKFEVKPGKSFMTNGAPQEIIYPFNFGVNNSDAMNTSKEFERMLLMATGTVDSNGQVSQVSRDSQGMDMATATLIKKNKRGIVNRSEDFIIPFIKKAAWRYMQFDPERYPSVDAKFIIKATLGIMAREHEQKQLAFLMQTLGAQSPLTPILMNGILANSSISNREAMIEEMKKMSQPNPQKQQLDQMQMQQQSELMQAQIEKERSAAMVNQMTALKLNTETKLLPEKAQADIMAAISKNLPDNDAAAKSEFDRRVKLAELMIKEKDVDSNERIAMAQMSKGSIQ